jgi:hypothetical protein
MQSYLASLLDQYSLAKEGGLTIAADPAMGHGGQGKRETGPRGGWGTKSERPLPTPRATAAASRWDCLSTSDHGMQGAAQKTMTCLPPSKPLPSSSSSSSSSFVRPGLRDQVPRSVPRSRTWLRILFSLSLCTTVLQEYRQQPILPRSRTVPLSDERPRPPSRNKSMEQSDRHCSWATSA